MFNSSGEGKRLRDIFFYAFALSLLFIAIGLFPSEEFHWKEFFLGLLVIGIPLGLYNIDYTSKRIKNNIYYPPQVNRIQHLMTTALIMALLVFNRLVLSRFVEFEFFELASGTFSSFSLISLIWLYWKERREGPIYIERKFP